MIAEPAAPVGRQGGGVYGFQHQMPLGVDEGAFALGVGTPKEENEVFFFLGNDFDDGIGEGFPTFVPRLSLPPARKANPKANKNHFAYPLPTIPSSSSYNIPKS